MNIRMMERRYKVEEFIADWSKNTIKTCGAVFGILGAVSVIFPLTNLSRNNLKERIVLLLIILIIVTVLALFYTVYSKCKTKKILYESGKTKLLFEYVDLREIISNNGNNQITVVVPIHSNLDILGDSENISQFSVHKILYDYLEEKGKRLNKELLFSAGKKQITGSAKIGDWFLLTPKELGVDTSISFLLIVENEVETKEGGYLGLKVLSKNEYINVLSSLMTAVFDCVEQEGCVYIPLLGSGKANVANARDIMFLMEEILRFYKRDIQHEIHVVINKKDKKHGAELYHLRDID